MQKQRSNRKTLLILLAALVVIGAVLSAVIKMKPITSKKLTAAVEPYLREEDPASGGTLPDDPKFVLYDMDSKTVYIPDPKWFPNGTDDPEQVNVIVAYRQVFVGGRYYVSGGKGNPTVYSRDLVVSVIRMDTWQLIDQKYFEENGGSTKKELLPWKDHLTGEANEFINAVMERGPVSVVVEAPIEAAE